MIPKEYRHKLTQNRFIGSKKYSSHLVVVSHPAPSPCWAVSISKKVAPHAVDRNRLRRQILNYLYAHKQRAKLSKTLIIIKNTDINQLLLEIDKLCLNSIV